MSYDAVMDESDTKPTLWWETCPHRSCASHETFRSPLLRELHLSRFHEAPISAASFPGPPTDTGVCDEADCGCRS